MTINLEEARKKLKAEKPREHYMAITIDGTFILPHKAAVVLLDAIKEAERGPSYSTNHSITSLDKYAIQSNVMPWQDYDRYKLAALLNVTYDTIKDAEEEARRNQQHAP